MAVGQAGRGGERDDAGQQEQAARLAPGLARPGCSPSASSSSAGQSPAASGRPSGRSRPTRSRRSAPTLPPCRPVPGDPRAGRIAVGPGVQSAAARRDRAGRPEGRRADRAELPERVSRIAGPQLVKPGRQLRPRSADRDLRLEDGHPRPGPDRVMFESFAGDQLTTFPQDPAVQYRLRRAESTDKVEVADPGRAGRTPSKRPRRSTTCRIPTSCRSGPCEAPSWSGRAKITVDVNRKLPRRVPGRPRPGDARRGHVPRGSRPTTSAATIRTSRSCGWTTTSATRPTRPPSPRIFRHRLLPRRHRPEVHHHRGRRLDRRARRPEKRGLASDAPDLAGVAAGPGRGAAAVRPGHQPAPGPPALAGSWCWRSARARPRPRRARPVRAAGAAAPA